MRPPIIHKPHHLPLLSYFLILLTISSLTHVHADSTISITRPASTVTISSNSPSFVFELNYTNAFDVSLDNSTDPNYASFCKAAFEEVTSNLQSQGPLTFEGDPIFDNVVTNENYSFILDSRSLSILAIDDSNPGSPILIKSNFANTGKDSELDETFLEIASDSRALYIVTKNLLLSYSLKEFYQAVADNKPVPPITNSAKDFPGYTAVETVKYYNNILYIVADKVVQLWFCAEGDVTPVNKVFDKKFLEVVTDLSIVDISFRGKFAFLLDSLSGVYTVDVSRSDILNFKNLGLTLSLKKGQLIQAVKNSLNIISSSSKTVLLTEYAIFEDESKLVFQPNRQSEVYQSVISMQADDTFLYLITGLFNIVIKHSVPSDYDTPAIEKSLFDFWQLYRIDAVTSIKRRYGSGLAVVRDKSLSVYTFTKNPLLKCDMEGVSEGRYNAYLKVREDTCDEKEKNAALNTFDTICETRQDINLIVASEGSDLGDITWSYKATIGLVAGIVLLLILILIFCCLFRKYKRQYEHLQSKIKFKKLQQGGKSDKGDPKGGDEGFKEKANQQDWRQKESGVPNFQNWDEDKKKRSVQDLGDMKQLDYDDIYAEVKENK